jgi:hypothetical protein
MHTNRRKTGGRAEMDQQWAVMNILTMLLCFSSLSASAIGNGTTAGRLRTTATTAFRIGNKEYSKASTDDLWNLAAETNTIAAQYRAYWLYLDSSGAASIAAGSNAASAALALKALPNITVTKSVIGVYVAGPSTDFDAGGGLAAQGTIHNGIPDGVPTGVPGQLYAKPTITSLVPS